MNPRTHSAVVIIPNAISKTLLEDVIQAQLHIEYILALNHDYTIEPGHLYGLSLMLANAERVLADARAALSAMHHRTLSHTGGSLIWHADCPELQPAN